MNCNTRVSSISFVLIILAFCLLQRSDSFQLPSLSRRRSSNVVVGNLFGGLFGKNSENESKGPKPVIALPADSVKAGPLKFFMQIYVVGQQNVPAQGSWTLNNNEENGSLDVYYKDGTGMFSVAITDTSIQINRHGQRPSLQYMLQESVFLHGILDEISQIAFDTEDIEQDKR
eukprot:CAMPEP_0117054268 /NCGR_PEP_ID=MMETSP0472-20121206/37610_1 /TAXON_ID=693140 ORGANISM="Tiarina fusus, Strain LIS" /NCGR_SAMPLE_ID=MMETSP0472 /ASSEMBLY_ACC=CAM_ASM_000603 /LENGTH=172 /DNA_ID=CAMNT_0004769791 /DNA_START=166 /DNA_END=680 /DNA_ORIENTATION=+